MAENNLINTKVELNLNEMFKEQQQQQQTKQFNAFNQNLQHGFMRRRCISSHLILSLDAIYNYHDYSIPCITVYFEVERRFTLVCMN